MKLTVSILGAALLAASTALYAQAPQGDTAKQERREKMRAAHGKATKACEGKQGDERRGCMQKEMCAQAKDPAKCEAGAKERQAKRAAFRAEVREACKGKEGEALKACVREHRGKK